MARITTSVRIDMGPLKEIRGGARARVRKLVEEQANLTREYAVQEAPVGNNPDSGPGEKPLRETIYVRAAPGANREEFIVGSTSIKAVWVTYGTPAHIIVPKRAKVLRFEINGEVIWTKEVHHPGTKPNDFLGRARERAEREFIPRLLPPLRQWMNSKTK